MVDSFPSRQRGQSVISAIIPSWLVNLTTGYEDDKSNKAILQEVSDTGKLTHDFTLGDGVL